MTIDDRTCWRCRQDVIENGGRYVLRKNRSGQRPVLCGNCMSECTDPIRKCRASLFATGDFLEWRNKQHMRIIAAERESQLHRDKIRSECQEDVARDIRFKVRSMPFWRRVRFVFSPFQEEL